MCWYLEQLYSWCESCFLITPPELRRDTRVSRRDTRDPRDPRDKSSRKRVEETIINMPPHEEEETDYLLV